MKVVLPVKKLIFLSLVFFFSVSAIAQEILIQGKVTDANSGDPIPFANVTIKGVSVGTNTDFDGRYKLKLQKPFETLVASYIGYKSKEKKLIILLLKS